MHAVTVHFDPASFSRTESHVASRLRSFVTRVRHLMVVCKRKPALSIFLALNMTN